MAGFDIDLVCSYCAKLAIKCAILARPFDNLVGPVLAKNAHPPSDFGEDPDWIFGYLYEDASRPFDLAQKWFG